MEIITGRITSLNKKGITIYAPYENYEKALSRKYETVEIELKDGRIITHEQRKKAYALINDIADYTGDYPESMKQFTKIDFVINKMKSIEQKMFSLSNCSVSMANEFITYLIDFCILHEIPTKKPLYDYVEDLEHYTHSCLMNKKCVVCGQFAELHHYDAIGMGRDREKIIQIGMLVLPLCRKHHSVAYLKGKEFISNTWHVVPIELTKEIEKIYKKGELRWNKISI